MPSPRVSVIIPVYNGEKTLEGCLTSVLAQTYKEYEVIMVNNNSNDRTAQIIEAFAATYKNLRSVFEAKQGRGPARNAGIREARGEIILMTDADCVVPAEWIDKLIEPLTERDESVVVGGEQESTQNYWTRNIQSANHDLIRKNMDGGYVRHIDTKNFAIRERLMKELMFDETLRNFEDLDLYMRLKGRAKIVFIDTVRVTHEHKDTFRNWYKLQADRGYWTYMIYKKHAGERHIEDEPMFGSFSVKNWLTFPLWFVFQFYKNPRKIPFLWASEIGWRSGVLAAILQGPLPFK